MALRSSGVPRREPCAKCGNPVYIAERLTVGKSLYHRTCFRCARCNSQLTLANYYETETLNQFCCETCPDEEASSATTQASLGVLKEGAGKPDEKSMLSRSLSDEEKSAGLKKLSDRLQMAQDEYSSKFETALEDSLSKTSEYSKARSQFLSANFVDDTSDSEIPPELPKTKPPDITSEKKATPPTGRRDVLDTSKNKDASGESAYFRPYSPKLGQKTTKTNEVSEISISASEKQKTTNVQKAPSSSVINQSSINSTNNSKINAKPKNNEVTKDKSQTSNVRKTPDTLSLVKNRMKLFEKSSSQNEELKSEQTNKKSPSISSKSGENLKRPLTDIVIVPPEKRMSRDTRGSILKSPTSPVLSKKASGETLETRKKSPKDIAQTQGKLNFLLHKQIALKEGKITPKSIINQAKTESAENLTKKASDMDDSKLQKPKSLDNLLVKPKLDVSKSTTTEELVKSLRTSPNRKSFDENKMKSFPLRKTGSASEKILSGKSSITRRDEPLSLDLDGKQAKGSLFLEKISPEKEKTIPTVSTSPYRLRKQQSMEEIPKNKLEFTTKTFLGKNWKDGRKENVYQSSSSNRDRYYTGTTSNTNASTSSKSIKDYVSPYRRFSTENPLRTGLGLTQRMGTPIEHKSNLTKSRSAMFTSDTELNNILNRKDDWSPIRRKSTGYLPMRSIENLYRSNSEENIPYRNVQKTSSDVFQKKTNYHLDRQSKTNSVSALKNKFECLSVVESSPTRCLDTKTDDSIVDIKSPETEDTDVANRSVSERLHAKESHGELLRDGHLMQGTIDKEESMERSEHDQIHDDSSDVIVVDLTQDSNSPELKMSEVIIVSDDSVIEISDSSSFNQTGSFERLKEKKPETTDYPEDLNPFGDDEKDDQKPPPIKPQRNVTPKKTKDPLNPFEDSEEDEDHQDQLEEPQDHKPTPAARKKIIAAPLIDESHVGNTPEYIQTIQVKRINTNPFEEDEDENNEVEFREEDQHSHPPPVSGMPKKVISAPRISLNPFWSDADEDEPEDDDDEHRPRPVPKPRKLRNAVGTLPTPEPKPRTSNLSISAVSYGSNSSLSSGQSGGQSVRKKKPAPRPPIPITPDAKNESPNESSLTASPSTSVSHSPRLPTKYKKSTKAPLPPSSTPYLKNLAAQDVSNVDISPIPNLLTSSTDQVKPEDANEIINQEEWSNQKDEKDKANENRRSQVFNSPSIILPPTNNSYQEYIPNKSTYGKWKRKKGPAPSRPVPQRRMIKALPVSEFRKELDLIELQKQGLEKQGVRLEQIIRDRCEGPEQNQDDACNEDTVPIDVEDLILQLFEVVNEKNELSRREAELMYLQRQQRLEEEHAEMEYQIRCLMMQPEANKTDSDKAKEEELIQRLVEIVERRNEIIECLEMDRLREAEEDDSISTSLNSYASRRDEQHAATTPSPVPEDSPEGKASKKEKSKRVKKDKKKKSDAIDADKDVDESESSTTSITKEKKKKKFALF